LRYSQSDFVPRDISHGGPNNDGGFSAIALTQFQDTMIPSTPRKDKKSISIDISGLQTFQGAGGIPTPSPLEEKFDDSEGHTKRDSLPNVLLTPNTELSLGMGSKATKTRKSSPVRSVPRDNKDPGYIIQIGFGKAMSTIREVNYERMPHLVRDTLFQKRRSSFSDPAEKRRKMERSRRSTISSVGSSTN
jgi:hypothetical protein